MSRIINIHRSGYGRFSSGGHRNLASNARAEVRTSSNESFLQGALPSNVRQSHYSSRDKLAFAYNNGSGYGRREWNELGYNVPTTSLLVQTAHGSFAGHIPLSLRPDTIWYAIVHEVAVHVKQNSARYADLFTDTPDSQQNITIRVQQLDWPRVIPMFYPELERRIGADKCALFVPKFSTTTDEDRVSTLVALMDIVSPYYKYTVESMCHIPQVSLEGTAEDWRSVYDRTVQLRTMFHGLDEYFVDLLGVLEHIANTAAGNEIDNEFWSSLYKYQESSGGEYVSGWITAFFAHVQTPEGLKPKDRFDWEFTANRGYGGYATNEFPAHVSVVPFVLKTSGKTTPMSFFAGITGVDYAEENFLQPRLGYGVVELTS